MLVSSGQATEAMAGDRLAVSGRLRARPGAARGDPFAGRIDARTIDSIERAGGFFRAANLIRSRVENQLSAVRDRPAAALLSWFLIGDIRELTRPDGEALRRAGLSHYVAVSGSNVALFLMLWWFILAIWILQLFISPWWLSRYRFGPAEWLWRTLTYGKKQPMRIEGALQ